MEYEPRPTADELDVLSRHLGVRVYFEHRIDGGQSATTDVLRTARDTRCVLRRHGRWSVGFDDGIADRELAVLEAVRGAGVVSPSVLWAGPFTHATAIVTEFVEGAPVLEPGDPVEWAEQLATTLATLHRVAIGPHLDALLAAAPPQPVDLEPSPRFYQHAHGEELLDRRRRLSKLDGADRTLTHGDFWPGNLLWRDREVVAVLDWEAAQLDDPMADVGYCMTEFYLLGFESAVEPFLARYRSLSGNAATSLDYWVVTAACRALPDLASYVDGWRGLGLIADIADVESRLDRLVERVLD